MMKYKEFTFDSPLCELNEYVDMCLDLMHIHFKEANKLNLYDNTCALYTEATALSKLGKDYNYFYFVLIEDKIIGYMRLSNHSKYTSDFYYNKGEKSIKLVQLYIKDEYRRKGYGRQVINDILNSVDRLDLDCFYTLDAHKFYQSIGFTPVYTTYTLKGNKA